MYDEIQTGWHTCRACGKEYHITHFKHPIRDTAHDIGCPTCGVTIGRVPKGTDDYSVQSRENFEKQREEEAKKPNCPKCGRKMTIREGYSKFWGCLNYPDCDGIRKI